MAVGVVAAVAVAVAVRAAVMAAVRVAVEVLLGDVGAGGGWRWGRQKVRRWGGRGADGGSGSGEGLSDEEANRGCGSLRNASHIPFVVGAQAPGTSSQRLLAVSSTSSILTAAVAEALNRRPL